MITRLTLAAIVLFITGLVLAIALTSLPASAARTCAAPECYLAECWQTANGRLCRRVCRQRCWNDASYYGQSGYWPTPHANQPNVPSLPPELLALLGAAMVVALVMAIVQSNAGKSSISDIAQIKQASANVRSLAADAESQTSVINAWIATEEASAFERGRHAAEQDWQDYTHHD